MMMGVINKFFIASMVMWIAPVMILYGFNHNMFPGLADFSDSTLTLLSGFIAVISVNVVIAFYICMAMKEPTDKHEPDPVFLSEAEASVKQTNQGEAGNSAETREKRE